MIHSVLVADLRLVGKLAKISSQDGWHYHSFTTRRQTRARARLSRGTRARARTTSRWSTRGCSGFAIDIAVAVVVAAPIIIVLTVASATIVIAAVVVVVIVETHESMGYLPGLHHCSLVDGIHTVISNTTQRRRMTPW